MHKGRQPHERFEFFTWGCWEKLVVVVVPVGTDKGMFWGLSSGWEAGDWYPRPLQ